MSYGYPAAPKTLGQHLRLKRMRLGLGQTDLAAKLGVSRESISAWENGQSNPKTQLMGRVMKFLGNDPMPQPEEFGGRLRRIRTNLGLSQKALGALVGTLEATINRWETERSVPNPKKLKRLLTRFPELGSFKPVKTRTGRVRPPKR